MNSDADLLAWAERFISTPSVSADGNEAIARAAGELFRAIGLAPAFDETVRDGVRQINVHADAGPSADADGILLVTHLDTVPPGAPGEWTATGGDPFRPTRDGDRLYGLGSADAKVDLVAKAFGLAAAAPLLSRRVRIAGTFGEEIGLLGARALVAEGRTKGFRAALVGEPSELACVHAHKGYWAGEAVVTLRAAGARSAPDSADAPEISFEGRAAHSSAPALGENAIEAALARLAEGGVCAIAAIGGIAGGDARNRVPARCRILRGGAKRYDPAPLVSFHRAWRRFAASLSSPVDSAFDPSTSVASLNLVATDGDAVRFVFDVRPLPGGAPDLAPLEAAARVKILHGDPSLHTPVDGPLVRAVGAAQRAVGLPVRLATKATCTEAGVLSETGLETVVVGPGRSAGNVHRPDEHTLISQLLKARDLYAAVLCGSAS